MRCWRCGVRNPAAAAYCVECHADLSPRSPISTSLKHEAVANTPRPRSSRMRFSLGISLALAVALGLAGFGAVRSAQLLQYAMRSAGPADVAASVCTAYKTQRYDLLAGQIDTTYRPTVAGRAATPAAVQTQLRALDKIDGTVQQCQLGRFEGDNNAGRIPILLQRTRAPLPSTVVLQLRRGSSGAWKISLATDFAGTSA